MTITNEKQEDGTIKTEDTNSAPPSHKKVPKGEFKPEEDNPIILYNEVINMYKCKLCDNIARRKENILNHIALKYKDELPEENSGTQDRKIEYPQEDNITQFSQRYGYFILHPGTKGIIQLQYDAPLNSSWFQNNANASCNMTKGATLLYMAKVTSNHITIPFAVLQYHDDIEVHFQICHFNGMFTEPCNVDNKRNIPLNEIPEASKLLHSGIDTSYTPKSVIVHPKGSHSFTVTISANSSAKEGVYWLSLGRSLCGPAHMDKDYHFTMSRR